MRQLGSVLLYFILLACRAAPEVRAEVFAPPPLPSIVAPQNDRPNAVDRSDLPPPPVAPQKTETNSTEAAPAIVPETVAPPSGSRQSGDYVPVSPYVPHPVGGDFPALPPDPDAAKLEPLPPLEEELWLHGGSYLYQPEGDRLNWPGEGEHYELLRLPEDWQEPRPATAFSEFLGADPIEPHPLFRWPGPGGYVWEPRFVGYGNYQLFAFALEENNRRQDVLGHQLVVDLDLQLTGTERFHVQFRPLGRGNTGGSYYRFNDPQDYVNNASGEPARYWFEGELHSMLGAYVDPFAALDYHVVAGKFPFALHNTLLINDEILGVAVTKNNLYWRNLSNLNVQAFYGFNDVDTFNNADAQIVGMNALIDYRRMFFEATYVFAAHDFDDRRDSHYAALSGTRLLGPTTVAARGLFKFGDRGGLGNGELFVVESNHTRHFDNHWSGIESGVFYANAFLATQGWSNLGGSNFNRLRTAFEVNPLVRISAGRPTGDTWGIAGGVQLFRLHEDESWIPEFAFESPGNASVWGVGLRYQRKTGPRSFFEALGSFNFSNDRRFDREGVFLSETIVF